MIKSIFTAIICLGILCSIQVTYAQEELELPEGKNIKEWEAISAALIVEKRYDEAIIYLDKILDEEPENLKALSNKAAALLNLEKFKESLNLSNKVLRIEPDRISALTNKTLALGMLSEYEESFLTSTKILVLEPDNEKMKIVRARILSATPTISTNNSNYEVHGLLIVRDQNGNLIATTESTNARYLSSLFTEAWWKSLDTTENKYGHTISTKIIDSKLVEIFTKTNTMIVEADNVGMMTLEREMSGYTINLFELFVPMIEVEKTDTATVQWTIIKK
jgi:tetratricopeptide (TPR) repeat protein